MAEEQVALQTEEQSSDKPASHFVKCFEMYSPTFRQFMQHVVQAWMAEKRRKLPKESQLPNQPLTLGERVSQVAHETMTEPKSEQTLHNYLTALNLPSDDSD